MITTVIRFAKRFVVLVPGLVIAYLSIFNIFPLLNDQLPVVIAVLITYILAAYVLIPAAIRLLRIILPARHLPLYCVTSDGFASDPLNIGIIGTRKEVIHAMTAAGWHGTDKLTLRSALRTIISTVYNLGYATAPMSNLYLFGRKQDLSFQIPIESMSGSRHHVRFWATTYKEGKRMSVRSIHWHNRRGHIRNDRLLWVGAASRDIGVTFIRHNAQLTHLVDPDTDAEREFIVRQLQGTSLVSRYRSIKLGEPHKIINLRGWYRHLKTDGRMTILEITAQKTAKTQGSAQKQAQSEPRQLLTQS